MEKQIVIKCSSCKYLKSLEDYNSSYRINKITEEKTLVKNKTCKECLWNVCESHSQFVKRHGMTKYRYTQNKK